MLGEIEEVRGSATKQYPLANEIEDTAEVLGTFASGAHLSCMFTSVSEVPHSERLELYGTEGGILLDQMADPVVRVFGGHQDFAGEALAGVPYGPDAWHPGGWHYESVIAEVTDYVHSLVEGRPTLIDSGDAAYAIGVVEATYRSVAERRPVRIDRDHWSHGGRLTCPAGHSRPLAHPREPSATRALGRPQPTGGSPAGPGCPAPGAARMAARWRASRASSRRFACSS